MEQERGQTGDRTAKGVRLEIEQLGQVGDRTVAALLLCGEGGFFLGTRPFPFPAAKKSADDRGESAEDLKHRSGSRDNNRNTSECIKEIPRTGSYSSQKGR